MTSLPSARQQDAGLPRALPTRFFDRPGCKGYQAHGPEYPLAVPIYDRVWQSAANDMLSRLPKASQLISLFLQPAGSLLKSNTLFLLKQTCMSCVPRTSLEAGFAWPVNKTSGEVAGNRRSSTASVRFIPDLIVVKRVCSSAIVCPRIVIVKGAARLS
nr:uncharacterized protein I203_08507 [Kwoniella mangroviensis CBS 8507]OCF62418.1 hypothetical protein I203_08507 [Kwoniella mangroviensis CBS 8507]